MGPGHAISTFRAILSSFICHCQGRHATYVQCAGCYRTSHGRPPQKVSPVERTFANFRKCRVLYCTIVGDLFRASLHERQNIRAYQHHPYAPCRRTRMWVRRWTSVRAVSSNNDSRQLPFRGRPRVNPFTTERIQVLAGARRTQILAINLDCEKATSCSF